MVPDIGDQVYGFATFDSCRGIVIVTALTIAIVEVVAQSFSAVQLQPEATEVPFVRRALQVALLVGVQQDHGARGAHV